MPSSPPPDGLPGLRRAVVLRVSERGCDVWSGDSVASIPFAPLFPTPRTERVSPGHLVAVATPASGAEVIVWRWFDAVVLETETSETVRLWEPAHGEVTARRRSSYRAPGPGSRAYASAGLPGADWWVAGPVVARPGEADVDIDEVHQLFTVNGLWTAAFGTSR